MLVGTRYHYIWTKSVTNGNNQADKNFHTFIDHHYTKSNVYYECDRIAAGSYRSKITKGNFEHLQKWQGFIKVWKLSNFSNERFHQKFRYQGNRRQEIRYKTTGTVTTLLRRMDLFGRDVFFPVYTGVFSFCVSGLLALWSSLWSPAPAETFVSL